MNDSTFEPVTSEADLLVGFMKKFAETSQIVDALNWALPLIAGEIRAEAGSLFLHKKKSNSLECVVCVGPVNILGLEVQSGVGLVGAAFESGVSSLVNDAHSSERHDQSVDAKSGFDTRSIITVPVTSSGTTFGCIQAINHYDSLGHRCDFSIQHQRILEKLAILLGVALQNVELASQIVKDALLAKDLKTASEMQASLFPTFEQCNEVVGRVIPARNLSGDFIEFVQIGDEIIFCAGDVAGKGIPAALTVARCLAIFDLLAKQKASIDVIAKQMNSELIASNFRQASLASFVTFFIGKIHLNTRNLEYINCGHGDQLVFDDEKNHEIISSSMPPLGVVANDLFAPCTSRCDLQNKRLFVFSDGITEATRNGKEIGFQGVKTIVSALYSENSQNLLAKFMSVFDVGALVTSDDASMIIVG